ncbi:telomere repeats-binding bouquet formation protein 2 isoform X2 [Hemicordylus capensis]|uniref:telomere repeats-binding bouquet formation protein 2 isoform X2 n=1 Tax=Hemicordylus capensis TaxID=884348 RepID=UPI0023047510|nr:telomere repeats-binding bouquet formation protein 2 isoform X2 [Hemicordylus capensis]
MMDHQVVNDNYKCMIVLFSVAVAEGGAITNQDVADYLFSNDASHPDTKRIHQSLDYLEDRIAVFHSNYLSASARSKMKGTVPLGHFLLPPACLQQDIRKKIGSFMWEQINSPLKPLPRQSSELNCYREEEELKAKRELDRSYCNEDHHAPGIPERGKRAYIPLQDYPASNMVTGYASAKEMKKYLGEMRDFIPGCCGYLAYWIQNEMAVFSDVKTKLKRKL